MINSLLPGFGGLQADCWAEAAKVGRPVEPDQVTIVEDAAGEGAVPRRDPQIRRPYAPEEIAEMESIRSARYTGHDPGHHHGVHPWDSLATTAPVMRKPSIDSASGDLVAVSYMAG